MLLKQLTPPYTYIFIKISSISTSHTLTIMVIDPNIDSFYLKTNIPRFRDVPIEEITSADRALVALQEKIKSEKLALQEVDRLKKVWGLEWECLA